MLKLFLFFSSIGYMKIMSICLGLYFTIYYVLLLRLISAKKYSLQMKYFVFSDPNYNFYCEKFINCQNNFFAKLSYGPKNVSALRICLRESDLITTLRVPKIIRLSALRSYILRHPLRHFSELTQLLSLPYT